MTCVSLSRPLPLRAVEPPPLAAALNAAYRQQCRQLAAHPQWFNGAKLLCRAAGPQGAQVYASDYARRLLLHEQGERAGGLGAVWAGAMFCRADGQVALVRRAVGMRLYPDHWSLACAGGLMPGERPAAALRRELQEEWGPRLLAGAGQPQFLATVWGAEPAGPGLAFVWQLPVGDERAWQPDPAEIADYRWVDPRDPPGPLDPTTAHLLTLPQPSGRRR